VTDILFSTPRERMIHLEEQTPTLAHNLISGFALDLNAHGRKPIPGHRTHVTTATLIRRFPEVLTGGLGLAFQLRAYRRVAAIRAKTRGPWRLAAHDLLGDLAQHLDPALQRDRAERIAADAIHDALPLLQAWLDSEAA
jgi:predicted P-loop ATPase/GTPase